MKDLYFTVVVNDNLKESKEVIKYYLTKDKSYGFKITIASGENLIEDEVISKDNITDSEETVRNLIKIIERSGREFSQIDDLVEDFLHESKIAKNMSNNK